MQNFSDVFTTATKLTKMSKSKKNELKRFRLIAAINL